MHRRRLLAALSGLGTAGLAGCSALDSGAGGGRGTYGVPATADGGDDDGDGTRASDAAPTSVLGGRTVRWPPGLARVATGRGRRTVLTGGDAPEGTVLTAGFLRAPGPESPARLALGVTNTAGRERTALFGPRPPFSGVVGRLDDPRTDRAATDADAVPGTTTTTGGTDATTGTDAATGTTTTTAGTDAATTGTTARTAAPDRPATAPGAVAWSGGDPPPGARVRPAAVGGVLLPVAGRGVDPGAYADVVPDRPTGGCWRATGPVPIGRGRTRVALGPGESVIGEYLLVGPPGRCLPGRGRLTFLSGPEPTGLRVATWPVGAERPGASRFGADRAPPTLPVDDGGEGPVPVRWFHRLGFDPDRGPTHPAGAPTRTRTAAPGATVATPAYLRPGRERLALPATVGVTLRNFSRSTLPVAAGDWALFRLGPDGDRWRRVAGDGDATATPAAAVAPGEAYTFELRLLASGESGGSEDGDGRGNGAGDGENGGDDDRENGGDGDPDGGDGDAAADDPDVTVGGLAGGTYAVRLGRVPARRPRAGPLTVAGDAVATERDRSAPVAVPAALLSVGGRA